jgi:Skp family chaperone for outer membrane proteins
LNLSVFQRYIGIGAAVAVMSVGAVSARAGADAPNSAYASVDMEEVAKNSKSYAKNSDDMKVFVAKLQNVNAKLGDGTAIFLVEAQMRELAGLYEKDTLTTAEKSRVSELETAGDARKAELSKLENTTAPTDENRKRYRELNDLQTAGKDTLARIVQEYQRRIQDREEQLTAKTLKEIRAAIADVAKSKSYAVVFDSKVAIYTANDITTDVIKQVNK